MRYQIEYKKRKLKLIEITLEPEVYNICVNNSLNLYKGG